MADISKDKYQEYADRIVSLLKDDQFYEGYKSRVKAGRNSFELLRRRHTQVIDMTWVNNIEECIVSLDNIVRNPRKFIVQEEDIVDISLARSISTESVKHLAQHTNMIAQVDKNGDVTPNKILNTSKEESYEIYENRFIYTLLKKVKGFITLRFDKIKAACALKDSLQLSVNSNFVVSNHQLSVKLDCVAQMSFDDLMSTDNNELTDIERVAKLDRIISDFLASPFAKQMVSSAPVRPPIQRTNVILKNPDFKKALVLWQFIENYRDDGFKLVDEVSTSKLEDQQSINNLTDIITLNSFIFETLANGKEIQVGEEGYSEELTVLDQPSVDLEVPEQPEEEEKEEQPEEPEQPEQPEEPEQEEPEQPEEPEQEEEEQEEQEEQPEEQEEPEVEQEEVPEEVEKEIPQEPETIEEKEFIGDDNLYPFEVKKLYKRPEEDRVSPEEVKTINSALDRVLEKYKNTRSDFQIEMASRNRQKRKDLESISIDRIRKEREEELSRLSMLKDLTKLRTISTELDKQYKILRELESLREDLHVEIAMEKGSQRLNDLKEEDEKLLVKITAVKDRINAIDRERLILNSEKAKLDGAEDTALYRIEEVENLDSVAEDTKDEQIEEVAPENVLESAVEDSAHITEETVEPEDSEEKKDSVELNFDEEGNLIESTEEEDKVDLAETEQEDAVEEPVEEIKSDVSVEPTPETILKEVLPEDVPVIEELKDVNTEEPLDDVSDEDILKRVLGTEFNTSMVDTDRSNYDFEEDECEDKFMMARRMINTRYTRNKEKGIDERDEALKIIDSIYNSPKADV